MFCSNCGKTIRPEDDACQHCGARLGEGRFYGNTYTSSQVRLPVEALNQAPEGGMVSYTRTNYMSYDNQPEDDVYSNTTYRPLLGEEEDLSRAEAEEEAAAEEAEEASAAQEESPAEETSEYAPGESASSPEPTEEAPAQEETEEPVAEEDEEEEFEVSTSPLPPIKKAAISPKVLSYMEELEGREQRKGSGLRMPSFLSGRKKSAEPEEEYEEPAYDLPSEENTDLAGEYTAEDAAYAPEDEAYTEGAEYAADAEDDASEAGEYVSDADADSFEYFEEADDDYSETGSKPNFLKNLNLQIDVKSLLQNRILKIVVAAVLVVAVAIGGIVWLRFVTAQRSRIVDVTYNAYTQGIELLKTHAGDTYRTDMTQAYLTNTSFANSTFEQDMSALNALLPETPAANDELFITTLTIIQDAIENAVKADADAELNGTSAARAADSDRDWQAIRNAVQTLEEATNPGQLSAIVTDLESIVAPTPTPAPTPTAVAYKTLQNGMMDSLDVKLMQNRLKNLGFLDGEADSDFGPATEKAVKAFQRAAGMTEDGIATPEVQQAIFADNAPRTGASATATPTPAEGGSPEGSASPEGDTPADPSPVG